MANPKIRFKREDGTEYPDWEEKKIIDFCEIVDYRGKTPKKFNEGIFLITAKNIRFGYIDYECSKEYISPSDYDEVMRRGKPNIGDILITTEAPCGMVARVDRSDIALAQRVIKYASKIAGLINEYLLYYMLSYHFQSVLAEKSTGGTVKGIKGSVLHQQLIKYPAVVEEQRKIAEFLFNIDEIITQSEAELKNLEAQKKGVIQKIFSQEVRFKREDGSDYPEWEEKKMSDIFIEIVEKNRPELPVLSILQGVGTILRDSSERRIAYDKSNLANYKAMKKGDFIIHLRTFEGGLEHSNHIGISSPAYKILRTDLIIPEAYKDYFRSYDFIEGKLAVAVTGIRDGKNIDMPTFWEIVISIPCLEEQKKIAEVFSAFDEVISSAKQELEKWKELKKGLLQQMFV